MPNISIKNLSSVDTIIAKNADGKSVEIAPLGRHIFDLDHGGPITTSLKDPVEQSNDNETPEKPAKQQVFEKAKVKKKPKKSE